VNGEQGFGTYTCVLYKDGFFGSKSFVEQFAFGLDPDDPHSLQITLVEAIRRRRGSGTDPAPYSLDVLTQTGSMVIQNYRTAEWPD
jgi:hypothetical protein